MTQEEKELLIRDLCARLPYGVIIQHPDLFRPSVFVTEKLEEYYKGHFGSDGMDVEFVKPYLRPMSSMTLEEIDEFQNFKSYLRESKCKIHIANYNQIQWLLNNHFDFMELISKGLAIEITKDNNPYKDYED